MKYLAHKSNDGREQSLIGHLNATSVLCGKFADSFGLKELGECIGLYHDIGKYSEGFQNRIKNDGPKVDHSTAGAKELFGVNRFASLCVAGHHTGLMEAGSKASSPGDGTFSGRMKKDLSNLDYSAYKNEIPEPPEKENFSGLSKFNTGWFSVMFMTRMLFSCLVDADYLDTEAFMTGGAVGRGEFASIDEILKMYRRYIEKFKSVKDGISGKTKKINEKRNEILTSCVTSAGGVPGLYSLTVPTGGGKTIASLGFALEHAHKHNKKRIIYVIPFTSIIEQNADVFREIVGAENVVEHHMNVDYDDYDDAPRAKAQNEKKKLATENWDAPIIVTTNVQFFESLFAKKASRCRKLHNIADSVVIFDEAQMIPAGFLRPCVKAISELVLKYDVTALICTATQPSLDKFFKEDGLTCREICADTENLCNFFKRVRYEYVADELNADELAGELNLYEQVLCVVNTRAAAQEIYDRLNGEGRFHLSTLMCPQHRRAKLKEIRKRLKSGLPCRVISTSLVEAGVDLDFPAVYRELAGLDSIIQVAGRCNREGKNDPEKSCVRIFNYKSEKVKKTPSYIVLPKEVSETVIRNHREDPVSVGAIRDYFDLLHDLKGEKLDRKDIVASHGRDLNFPEIAEKFVLIEDAGRSVLIPTDEKSVELAEQLRNGTRSRGISRRAGQYSVSVYMNQFEKLQSLGAVEVLDENFAILLDMEIYSEDKGLTVNTEDCAAVFI